MSLAEYGYQWIPASTPGSWAATQYSTLYDGCGKGTFAKDSSQASMTYLCEYTYVDKFLDTVLGKTVVSGTSLRRSAASPDFDTANGSTPELHPFFDNFYAASAEVEPRGKPLADGGNPNWSKAKLTVMFRPPTYSIIPDSVYGSPGSEVGRFVDKIPEGSAEFQTSQGRFFFYTDPSMRPLDIQPGFVLAAQKYSYTWRQIPSVNLSNGYPNLGYVPNLSTILPLLGSINSVTFDGGFAPGTVLFSAFSPKLVLPQCATGSGYYWDITYIFGIRDYGVSTTPVVSGEHCGWNYAYDPTRAIWDLYTDSQTAGTMGNPQYTYADLSALFQVTW